MMKETNADILKNMIQHHGATDEDWKQAKQMVKAELAEHERQKAQAAEKRRLWEIAQAKPENFVPKQALSMHVPENLVDFENKCATCNLNELIRYTNELKTGLHKQDFRGRSTAPIVQFLEAQIAKRQPKDNNSAHNELFELSKQNATSIINGEKRLKTIEKQLNPNEKTKHYTT